MKTFPLCFALTLVTLAGCRPDYAVVSEGEGESRRRFDGRLVVGERADVSIQVAHPEIEGAAQVEAIEVTTDRPDVAFAKPGGRGFYMFGVAPGTASFHVRTDTSYEADFVVTVEPAR